MLTAPSEQVQPMFENQPLRRPPEQVEFSGQAEEAEEDDDG